MKGQLSESPILTWLLKNLGRKYFATGELVTNKIMQTFFKSVGYKFKKTVINLLEKLPKNSLPKIVKTSSLAEGFKRYTHHALTCIQRKALARLG